MVTLWGFIRRLWVRSINWSFYFSSIFFFPIPTLGQNWSNKAVYSKARKLKSQNCYYKLITVGRIYNSVLIYLELSRCNLFFVVFNHSRSAVFIHSLVTNTFTTQETCSFSSKLHSTISSFSLCTRYVGWKKELQVLTVPRFKL